MQREFQPTVYLLANRRNGTIYTGVTSRLVQRIQQHRDGAVPGFTREHGIRRIVTNDSDFHRFGFVEVIDPLSDDLPA